MDRPANGRRPRISASDAAFAGFGLVRRNPGAFVIWTAFYLLYSVIALVLQMWLAAPAMERMAAMQGGGSTPPSSEEAMRALASLGDLSLFYVGVLAAALIYASVMNAAVFRAVLRPGERGLGYLRFGRAELRQAGVSILVGLVTYGVYFVSLIVGVLLAVAVVIGVTAMAGGKDADVSNSPAAIAAAIAAGVLVVLFIVIPVVTVAVRLSLAGPLTLARNKVDVFGSWRLTKGRFWTLFGAYLLAALVTVIVSVLVLVLAVIVALVAGVSLESVSQTMLPDAKAMSRYITPFRLAVTLVNAPLGALWVAVQCAIPATIYAEIAQGGGEPGPPAIDRSHAFGSAVAYPSAPYPSAAPTPPDAL